MHVFILIYIRGKQESIAHPFIRFIQKYKYNERGVVIDNINRRSIK